MYLEKWEPIVKKGDMPGNYLCVQVTLKCPHCMDTIPIRTEGYLIVGNRDPDDLTNLTLCQLSKTWPCPNCGVVSALPDKQLKKFVIEFQAEITQEWVKQHA
jgi:predicted RNA-binding Zn-ribbon protein involved in translation (DUF1610 family)